MLRSWWFILLLQVVLLFHEINAGYKSKGKGKNKSPRTQPIVGGVVSPRAKSPWQLAILATRTGSDVLDFICGGSLISPQYALTAAHCLRNPNWTPAQLRVVAGEYDRSLVEGTEQTLGVSQVVVHPNYTGTLSDLYKHDIAVLRLNQSVTVNRHVKPVPGLAEVTTVLDGASVCYITGWGVTAATKGKKAVQPTMTNTLEEAEVRVLTNEVCNKNIHWSNLIEAGQMCAFNRKISACLGDSGGPLMCRQGTQDFIQVGVTSWGSKTCESKPSVFTRISSYRNWINDVMDSLKTPADNPV